MKLLALLLVSAFSFPLFAVVLATVGDVKITEEDFQRKLEIMRRQTTNPPTPEQFLEDLIRFEVGAQEAERLKLRNDPVVKDRFKQILYSSLIEKELAKKIEGIRITEAEMRAFYKKNPNVRVANILIEVRGDGAGVNKELARKRTIEILEEIKKTKRPFEDAARNYTEDQASKEAGGDLGFHTRISLEPVLYEAALKMKPGEISGPLETQYGFHIIKLTDKQDYDTADKQLIRAALFDERRGKIFDDYFAKLRKQYKIQINRTATKSLEP